MKILIVDDEMVSRRKMEIIMKEYGDCRAVENGNAAIRAFSEAVESGSLYDLVTLDVSLPDMDGTTVLKVIRDLEKGNAIPAEERVKVLMVTSHGDQETVISSISAGCDDYIKKPFTLERIFQKLEKFDLAV
jgi:two-component system chemotaxis response regulator CheY